MSVLTWILVGVGGIELEFELNTCMAQEPQAKKLTKIGLHQLVLLECLAQANTKLLRRNIPSTQAAEYYCPGKSH